MADSSGTTVSDDVTPHKPEFRAYPVRWYILAVFSLMAFTQSWAWNTWGPIASSAKLAYGWTDATISLLAAWGPVMFILSVFPFSWLAESKGLRPSCLVAAVFLVLGMAVRCITEEPPYVTWCMYLGQICVSTAGPVAMAIASVVSARWFPANQRMTATAIANRIMGIGGGFPFITGPLIVRDAAQNDTMDTNTTTLVHEIRHDIRLLMFIELGVAGLLFLLILAYFPSKPPTPPSLSVSVRKVDFRQGMRQIIRYKNFWLLGVPYSASYGMYIGWIATLDVNLQPLGISQKTAGWLGFVGALIGVIVAILMARLADYMSGRTKPILIGLFSVAGVAFLCFALMCDKIIPLNLAGLYISRTLSACCLAVMVPLVFETLCEATYPVPESVTNGTLTLLKNFWCLVFLSVLWVKGTGTSWMNWLVTGGILLCVPLLLLFQPRRGRLELDTGEKEVPTSGSDCPTGQYSTAQSGYIQNDDPDEVDQERRPLLR